MFLSKRFCGHIYSHELPQVFIKGLHPELERGLPCGLVLAPAFSKVRVPSFTAVLVVGDSQRIFPRTLVQNKDGHFIPESPVRAGQKTYVILMSCFDVSSAYFIANLFKRISIHLVSSPFFKMCPGNLQFSFFLKSSPGQLTQFFEQRTSNHGCRL